MPEQDPAPKRPGTTDPRKKADPPPRCLDQVAIDAYLRRNGPWARHCGSAVKARREQLGLTVIEVARTCNIGPPTLYKIEGGSMVPSDAVRALLAYSLDIEPESLWAFPSRLEIELISAARASK
jgi:DNA-binding XRE family transcriptional regulator